MRKIQERHSVSSFPAGLVLWFTISVECNYTNRGIHRVSVAGWGRGRGRVRVRIKISVREAHTRSSSY